MEMKLIVQLPKCSTGHPDKRRAGNLSFEAVRHDGTLGEHAKFDCVQELGVANPPRHERANLLAAVGSSRSERSLRTKRSSLYFGYYRDKGLAHAGQDQTVAWDPKPPGNIQSHPHSKARGDRFLFADT